ncbi:hypothetical protein SASPL_149681 [Salvia splendens]|uniref:Pectinesterase inhibitor domain-containing protein n=1 Tax=Salvia splendens TaxID=180675 RepID=A0A8X8Z4L1_SALSN|nr:hypothetical protein SASPL_149681 [Salvia splendens]
MASFNPYGNQNKAEQERLVARRKTHQRIASIVGIVLVIIIGGTIFLFTQTRDDDNNNNKSAGGLSTSLKASCAATLYPDSCYTSLSPLVKSRHVSPSNIYKLSLRVSFGELSRAAVGLFQHPTVQKVVADNNRMLTALESCRELFFLALDHLNDSASSANAAGLHDHRTWMSAAATYQETCVDDLRAADAALGALAEGHLGNCTEYTSNSLALVSAVEEALGGAGAGREWLTAGDRRMLETPAGQMKFDAVVARDGSKPKLFLSISIPKTLSYKYFEIAVRVAAGDDDFEFALLRYDNYKEVSAAEFHHDGPVFPVFSRDLIQISGGTEQSEPIPLRNLFAEEDRDRAPSCSSSEEDELESVVREKQFDRIGAALVFYSIWGDLPHSNRKLNM